MSSHSLLLTQEAKIAKIKSLLPKSDRRGRFFIPDEVFYAPPLDKDGLKNMLKQLAQWVGFKPVGLAIAFSNVVSGDSEFNIQDGKPIILINERLRNNPFACGGLVANGLLRYYLEYRKQILLDDASEQQSLTELAVVYSGLGLVALNQTTSFWEQKYPEAYKKVWDLITRPGTSNGAELVKQFAREYGLELGAFARYLCPWAVNILELSPSGAPVNYVRSASQKARSSSTALAVSIVVIMSGMALGGYVIAQQPGRLPLALRQEKETIDILKKSHELCLVAVTQKERAYDNETDFFIQRNVNADRLRCTSIRNLYNSRVERYNSQL